MNCYRQIIKHPKINTIIIIIFLYLFQNLPRRENLSCRTNVRVTNYQSTQRRLVVTDVSGQPVGVIFKN
jgi:hypothetical protein